MKNKQQNINNLNRANIFSSTPPTYISLSCFLPNQYSNIKSFLIDSQIISFFHLNCLHGFISIFCPEKSMVIVFLTIETNTDDQHIILFFTFCIISQWASKLSLQPTNHHHCILMAGRHFHPLSFSLSFSLLCGPIVTMEISQLAS